MMTDAGACQPNLFSSVEAIDAFLKALVVTPNGETL
jgi:hypothetical protein